jgi:alkylation response protein AidB-like acyl-CoA dehydrogenase
MADLETFGREVRTWLETHAPESLRGSSGGLFNGYWGGRKASFTSDDQKRWFDAMLSRGWTAPTWPIEYGGGGLSGPEHRTLQRELQRMRMPPALVGFGLVMIGPTLLEFGNEAQRREHLPGIIEGKIRWCQGYSEPGSGSDLASLGTAAVPDGDDFLISGQKIWTSYAEKADWIFGLVRTSSDGRKQEGITFILIDMDQPEVTTRPIPLISGASPFCEVFFDAARTASRHVIGTVGGGWTVAKALLQHERTMVGEIFAQSIGGGEELMSGLARTHVGPTEGPLNDPLIRDQIAQNAMDEQAFMLTVKRIQDRSKAGQRPGTESSILKVYGTELNQRRQELLMRIGGPEALGWAGSGYDDAALTRTREWLRSRGNTIEGGTSEIQLNIIAKRVLGLKEVS